MMSCIENGQNSLFLTYKRLLVFDIARTIKSFANQKKEFNIKQEKLGQYSVLTLHKFIYRLSKAIGVLHVLTERRKGDLLSNLNQRLTLVKGFIFYKLSYKNTNFMTQNELHRLKENIQN